MTIKVGERHDGGIGNVIQSCRHLTGPCRSDKLSEVGLLKLDFWDDNIAKDTSTLWVDSTGDLRILPGEPTAEQLAGLTTAIGTVVGAQAE